MTDAHAPLTAEELDVIENAARELVSSTQTDFDKHKLRYAEEVSANATRRLVAMARRAIEMENLLCHIDRSLPHGSPETNYALWKEVNAFVEKHCPPISADSDTKASQ